MISSKDSEKWLSQLKVIEAKIGVMEATLELLRKELAGIREKIL